MLDHVFRTRFYQQTALTYVEFDRAVYTHSSEILCQKRKSWFHEFLSDMNLGRKTHKGKTAMTNQRQESRVINDGKKFEWLGSIY